MSRFWCCMLLACDLISFSELSAVRASQSPRILEPPVSMNVSLIVGLIKLNCTAVADYIEWYVDNIWAKNVKEDLELEYSITTINKVQKIRKATLLARNSILVNNSKIYCRSATLAGMAHDDSEAILIRVQGLLESVNNLDVIAINSTTIFISWSPPFTLEGVPILGYNVTITNTTSGENETMSVEGYTTMLYYSIDHPDPDNNFTVTVVPINEVGAGEVSSPKKFVFPSFLEPSVTSAPVPRNTARTSSIGGSGQKPTSSAYFYFNSASSRNRPASTNEPVQSSTMAVYAGVPLLLIIVIMVCVSTVVLLTIILYRRRRKNRDVMELTNLPSPVHHMRDKRSGQSPPHTPITINYTSFDDSIPISYRHKTCSVGGDSRGDTFAITMDCSDTTQAAEGISVEQRHGEISEVIVETESSSLLSAQENMQSPDYGYSNDYDDGPPSSLPTPKSEPPRPKTLFRSKSWDARPVCRTYVNTEMKSPNDYKGASSPIKQVVAKLGFMRKGSLQLIKEEKLTKGLSEEKKTLSEECFEPSYHNEAASNI